MGWEDKRCCASSCCKHVQLPWNTCLMFDLHLDGYFLLVCCAPWINLSLPCSARLSSPSLQYFSLLCLPQYFNCFVTFVRLVTLLSLSSFPLSPLYHFHLLNMQQSSFQGVVELTTQLLRLISIICLPLCQMNKLGNTSREDCRDPLHLWVITMKKILCLLCIFASWG